MKNMKTLIRKDTSTPTFTAALFTVATTWKQPRSPTESWTDKDVAPTHNGIRLSRKKAEHCHLRQQVITVSEISQMEKDKERMISLMWDVKKSKWTNKARTHGYRQGGEGWKGVKGSNAWWQTGTRLGWCACRTHRCKLQCRTPENHVSYPLPQKN